MEFFFFFLWYIITPIGYAVTKKAYLGGWPRDVGELSGRHVAWPGGPVCGLLECPQ